MQATCRSMTDRIEALNSQLEDFILELRASRESPLMTFPKFDGSEALAWLAQANQYFLINKTPSDRRVDVAIDAISGPAMPWLKLLLMRCSSLSWDKFAQELLRRFGDTIPPESRVQHDSHTPGAQPLAHINNTKSHNLNTEPTPRLHPTPAQDSAHIKAELIGQRQEDVKTLAPDSQLKYSPPLLADPVLEPAPLLLPSQKGVTPHAYDSQPKDLVMFSAENKTAVLCPAPAAEDSTKPEISSPTTEGHRHPSSPPPPQPLLLALPQQNNEAPIAAVRVAKNHPKIPPTSNNKTAAILPSPPTVTAPLLSSSPPTTAMVKAPLLSSSPDIQIQPPCSPLLRCLVSTAGHQSTPTMVSFLGYPFASVGAPFSYLVMLRFLHIVGHLLWFDTLATTRKHEFEPPPDKVSILSSALRARLF